MAVKQPNTICKNVNCHHGADGGRKHYYACRYCVGMMNWRAVACCEACYAAYMEQVQAARSHGESVDILPDRTDMSKAEVKKLVHSGNAEDLLQQTKAELADVLEENPDFSIAEAVDEVNRKIDQKRKKK